MEHQKIALSPTSKTNQLNVRGSAFFYTDANAAAGVDTYVLVTPSGHAAIPVKPGQHFRMQDGVEVEKWTITARDGAATFEGNIIIGSGDFGDSNVNNTLTIAGVVGSVPVSGAVGISGTAVVTGTVGLTAGTSVTENLLAITAGYFHAASPGSYPYYAQIVSAAANVNGLIVQSAMLKPAAGANMSFLAKNGTPGSVYDGVIILSAHDGETERVELKNKLKVPAGLALWVYLDAAVATPKTITYTLL